MAGTAPDYANARWPGSDGLRVPQEMAPATFGVTKEVDINVGAATAITLNPSQLRAPYIYVSNAAAAAAISWPAVCPGLVFTVSNQSGQTVTFKVLGKTGIAVATAKHAILAMDNTAGDIVRVTADT